jgi:DNA-binding transcriptional regulator YdaS (Cro superfamily)
MSQRVPPADPTGRTPPEVGIDRSAQAIGMLGFGAAGMRIVRGWIEQVPPSTPVTWAAAQRADPVSLAELERLVRAAPPGWALMLAGPAADVAAAREAATAFGMLPAEIRSAVTGEELRRVWCPHCTASTHTDHQPGDLVECSGCTVPLRVPTARARETAGGTVAGPAGPTHHVA